MDCLALVNKVSLQTSSTFLSWIMLQHTQCCSKFNEHDLRRNQDTSQGQGGSLVITVAVVVSLRGRGILSTGSGTNGRLGGIRCWIRIVTVRVWILNLGPSLMNLNSCSGIAWRCSMIRCGAFYENRSVVVKFGSTPSITFYSLISSVNIPRPMLVK